MLSFRSTATSWTSILLTASILIQTSTSLPFPFRQPESTLSKRCETPCGWQSQLCCGSDQYCYTDSNNEAQCANGSPSSDDGYWKSWTSIWTETNLATHTSVYSLYVSTTGVSAAPTPTAGLDCNYQLNESQCGSICCASNQYCYKDNTCLAVGGGTTDTGSIATNPGSSPTAVDSSPTPTATATSTETPILIATPITSTGTITSSGVTLTSTGVSTPTVTMGFLPPVATGTNPDGTAIESKSGLSGGAIAGIVLGVLAGIAILALLCFCCVFRGLLSMITGIFRKKKDSDDHSSSRSSSSSSSHGSGAGPSRPTSGAKKTLFAGLLAGLLVFLARRGKNKKQSAVSNTSYTGNSSVTSRTSTSRTSTDEYMSRYGYGTNVGPAPPAMYAGGRRASGSYTTRPSNVTGPSRPPRAYRNSAEPGRPASYRSERYSASKHSRYSRGRHSPDSSLD